MKHELMSFVKGIKARFQSKDTPSVTDDGTYDALTPKIVTDNSVVEYFKALDSAFSKPDVRNIAVTGPYGAGKSTIILSYLRGSLKKDYINVSLADFSISGKSSDATLSNSEIELSILQQILYKEKKDNLPDSRIDRIQNRNKKHTFLVFLSTLTVMVPVVLLAASIFPQKILSRVGFNSNLISFFINAHSGRLIFIIAFSFLSIFSIVRIASKVGLFDKKIKLTKLALLQPSAEVTAQESSSLLNNCLDEIVYFFSRSKNKIVVFEDLDRLSNTEIFIKLREINQIVNNNLNSEPVKFIYACRDDIFLGSDMRTKFFDFILPVIPVMDARNAYTHLINKIKHFPAKDSVLLKQASLYITDMRSLQNIANEFNLFRKLVDENKNEAKIFALIFYKNIYAQDYNLTDKKAGVLYSFINEYRLKILHNHYYSKLDEQAEKLSLRIENLKRESASSASHLREEIICRFIPREMWDIVSFYKHSHRYDSCTPKSLYENEEEFLSYFSKGTCYTGYELRSYNLLKTVLIDTENLTSEYERRRELVLSNENQELKSLNIKIENLNRKLRLKNSIPLADLIRNLGEEKFKEIALSYISGCNDPAIIDEKQLEALRTGFRLGGYESLFYLLTNGYIMQDFMMFRSIFHEGGITSNDNDFIKAVGRYVSHKEINEKFAIDNVKDVISELIDQNFIYRDGAIHHQVVSYLMNKPTREKSEILSSMISRIFDMKEHEIVSVFKVLQSQFKNDNLFTLFVSTALVKNHHLDEMLDILYNSEYEHESGLNKIFLTTVATAGPQYSSNVAHYKDVVEDAGYKQTSYLDSSTVQPFLKNIKSLGVIYDDLTLPISDVERTVLRFICENKMYHFTKENFRVVVAGIINNIKITPEVVDLFPWSIVAEYNLLSIKSYIKDNLNLFVKKIFIFSNEHDDAIIEVLLEPGLNEYSKTQIIERMSFTAPDLSEFENIANIQNDGFSYYDLFYQYDRIKPSWRNLLDYVSDTYKQAVLAAYINKHAQELTSERLDLTDGEEYDTFYANILCSKLISSEAYSEILNSININLDSFDERISLENFQRIIDNNKLRLNKEHFYKAFELFGNLANAPMYALFAKWFSRYKHEFINEADYYLRTDEDDGFLEELLKATCQLQAFNKDEITQLIFKYKDIFYEGFLDKMNLTKEMLITMVSQSYNDSIKINLIIRLLLGGYTIKENVAELVNKLQDSQFNKIFSQKTATLTPANEEHAEALLAAFQTTGLIKKWSQTSEGRYHVIC